MAIRPNDSEIAYAKINLALHVRAREPDGYHRIETLFAFAEDGDLLTVAPAEALTLTIDGPFGAALAGEADNLVIRAANVLRDRFAVRAGAAIRLEKRLPIASGIGGGSADAAAALRLLARFWNLAEVDDALGAIARDLGADVPACLLSLPVRGEGRGDALTGIDDGALAGMPLLLVNPGVPVSTGAVFSAWDGVDRGQLGFGDPLVIAGQGRNDLEASARRIAPDIGAALALLERADGVVLARMSGSGATCFALFDTAAARDAADDAIAQARPGWWRLKTGLRGHKFVP